MIPPDNRISFKHLKNELPSHEKIEELGYMLLSERSQSESATWFMVLGMAFWGRQKCLEERRIGREGRI